MQQRSMEHEEVEEKELVKGSSFSDGHITDLAQQIAFSMIDDEDERKYEHIMNELHDQSMGITASTRPMQVCTHCHRRHISGSLSAESPRFPLRHVHILLMLFLFFFISV